MTIKTYTKPGDWKGTTCMKQIVGGSFHNGFADDCFQLVIESDICYIMMRIYEVDGRTGEVSKRHIMQKLLTAESIDDMIVALQRAKQHRIEMKDVWKQNGQTWLSSGGKKELGSQEEQNRIYLLPWEELPEEREMK